FHVTGVQTCALPIWITPGCPGLWSEEQLDGWKRIVEFVHANSSARIAVQLGHAGAKGSTRLAWEGIDQPLPSPGGPGATPNWPGTEERRVGQDGRGA